MRDLSGLVGRFLCRTGGAITRRLNEIACEYGITPAEGRTLEFIAAYNGPVYQKDIEEEYGLRPASASELLQNMEKQGLITRKTGPADRRRKIICITEARMQDAEEMVEKMAVMEARLIHGIETDRLIVFREVLEQILCNAEDLHHC